jgi:hypothetical protein
MFTSENINPKRALEQANYFFVHNYGLFRKEGTVTKMLDVEKSPNGNGVVYTCSKQLRQGCKTARQITSMSSTFVTGKCSVSETASQCSLGWLMQRSGLS